MFLVYLASDMKSDEYIRYIVSCMPFSVYTPLVLSMNNNYRLNTQSGDINWTERESSLKHHVRSNVKHQTKETAPGQTAAQEKSE